MDERTLTALKTSIEHWKENAVAETVNEASLDVSDCALCDEFWALDCAGCPVFSRTGRRCCAGSPYIAASNAFDSWSGQPTSKEARDNWRSAAIAEIAFLKSLLPEQTQEDA